MNSDQIIIQQQEKEIDTLRGDWEHNLKVWEERYDELRSRCERLEKVAEAADNLMEHPYGSIEYELWTMRLLNALDALKEG